jgi:peptide/nickel transport system substrate-binding protein
VLAAASCTGAGTSKAREGGYFRLGESVFTDSLNPFASLANIQFFLYYPLLVQYSPSLRYSPDFATSWDTSADGLTWTFHTVAGAKWSDGEPLTARDVAWTFQTVIKFSTGAAAVAAIFVDHLVGASAPDANTVVLTYDRPVANVLDNLTNVPIVPEHVFAKYAAGDGAGLRTFPDNPPVVSGGPFIPTKFVKDEVLLFQRNATYYGQRPHVERYGIRFFSSADSMVQALKRHEIDAIALLPETAVASLRKAGFVVSNGPSIIFDYLGLNSNPDKPAHRELLDPIVRLALDHAIDRAQIVKVAYLGFARPAASIVPPIGGSWQDPSLVPTTYDPGLANQLLDQAGYPKGPDGIRVASGHEMSYQVITPEPLGETQREFQIIQQDLRAVGVAVQERQTDVAAGLTAVFGPDGKYTTFDIDLWSSALLSVDPAFIISNYTCQQLENYNDVDYCHQDYDNLFDQQSTTLDPVARRQIVFEMQRRIHDDRPYLVLVYPDLLIAHDPAWTGFPPNGIPNFKFELLSVHRA